MRLLVDYGETQLTIRLEELEIELRDSFLHGLGKLPFALAELSFQLYPSVSGP